MKIFRFRSLSNAVRENFNRKKKNKEEIMKKITKPIIIEHNFPEDQYFPVVTKKEQIVLHHTVSPEGTGDLTWWLSNPSRIATSFLVERDGNIHMAFPDECWAHHIGVKSSSLKKLGFKDYKNRNITLNQISIGIEIDSWGGLILEKGEWRVPTWDVNLKKFVVNKHVKPINKDNVIVYDKPFRGFYGFEKYTDEQIYSVKKLIEWLCDKHSININFNDSMFDVSNEALSGKNGIWSHTSYRTDKSDIHPQENLKTMLKSLI